ncbi:Clp protease N-terminal domain-containing protein [Actinophytocola sp.]|uniref:Clp protease N-terminal domain-containing protein n=1 Tax=Actinophytocola sp. TaxID=1872138 RepID=UPI002D7E966C|nr:Clp protease N-terminal domain-containing protein [Actinophytocola sp.]HET9143904.1 Clp protease N-terminal domain-containing protein [Actinophytocola sp.]
MPKINVYLPDDLAESVRDAGVPVSAICQRALEQSIRRLSAIRVITREDLTGADPTTRLSQFTERARKVIRLGIETARTDGAAAVGTGQLLHGLLAEGENLGLQVLGTLEIEPGQVARELARTRAEPASGPPATGFDGPAAVALEAAVTESLTLGHSYVGCEHLLLGLIAEPDGPAGKILRDLGVELRATRRAVVAWLAGYKHLRVNIGTLTPAGPGNLIARIERLEQHVGLMPTGTTPE